MNEATTVSMDLQQAMAARLHCHVAQQIQVNPAENGSFTVDIPLQYDDGDGVRLHVSREGESWRVDEDGDAANRATNFACEEDLMAGKRGKLVRQIVELYGLTLENGGISKMSGGDIGDVIWTVAQAALEIARLNRLD